MISFALNAAYRAATDDDTKSYVWTKMKASDPQNKGRFNATGEKGETTELNLQVMQVAAGADRAGRLAAAFRPVAVRREDPVHMLPTQMSFGEASFYVYERVDDDRGDAVAHIGLVVGGDRVPGRGEPLGRKQPRK